MDQKELLLRSNAAEITDADILRCRSMVEALQLCKAVSGLSDKQITMELEIDPGQWSRIWSCGAHFPTDKIEPFMKICGNVAPIQYLALKYGYEIRPLKSALEQENESLKVTLAERDREMETIKRFLKETGG